MTSSPDRHRAVENIEPLPPALSSMWRLCKLGYRHEPRLMLAAFVLSQLAALPDALLALWLMLLGKGVLEHRPGMVQGAAIGLGVSAAATWFLRTVSTRVQRRFRDKVTIALVVHGPALRAFRAAAASADTARRVAGFVKSKVTFNACSHTMHGQHVALKDLLPGFTVAERGGVVLIAELQAQGYVYLRP